MHCENCGLCCQETEMLLSNEDIKRIEKLGYKKKLFVRYNKAGYAKLRNKNGHCVFYDHKKRICIIYEFKPEGCWTYPVIFDEAKGEIIIDDICKAADSIGDQEKLQKGKAVIELLARIDKQARERRS